MKDRKYYQSLTDDLIYDYIYDTLSPNDNRIIELSNFLLSKMTNDEELNHLILKDYYFIVNFFSECKCIDENVRFEFSKTINYTDEVYKSIDIIDYYEQIINEDIVISQNDFDKMYKNIRACFGKFLSLDFANYYFKHILNEDYKITDKENYKFCMKLLIEEVLKTKGYDYSIFIIDKDINASGRYFFSNNTVLLGKNFLDINFDKNYNDVFNTIFHEIRHGFIDKIVKNGEVSYKYMQILKDEILRTEENKDYNYQFQKDEIDARIHGQAMAYNYVKQLCPIKSKKMLKYNIIEFEKAKSDGKQNLRKLKRGNKIYKKTLDEAFDEYVENNNNVIYQFPILQLEYLYDEKLEKFRRKTSIELLKEKHEILEQIKEQKKLIEIENDNKRLSEKRMKENPKILLQTADIFGMKIHLVDLYKEINVYNGLLNKRMLSFKNLVKEYKDLLLMKTDNQEIKKEKDLLVKKVIPKKFFKLLVNYGTSFINKNYFADEKIKNSFDNFKNENLSR